MKKVQSAILIVCGLLFWHRFAVLNFSSDIFVDSYGHHYGYIQSADSFDVVSIKAAQQKYRFKRPIHTSGNAYTPQSQEAITYFFTSQPHVHLFSQTIVPSHIFKTSFLRAPPVHAV